ncbi:MAG: SDR family oxidoreductase [Promethearchaeota archaeon]|nr:MAG: SDR family oxidoreductase [Candidatus Lokiarchaeota archaeon]
MSLKDKIAVITGAAQGIGYGIAAKFAQEGAKIALIDLKDTAKIKDKILEMGGDALSFTADVVDESAIQSSISEIVNKWGKIDVLVNNAGIYPLEHLKDISVTRFKRVMDTNINGVFICTQQCAKIFIEKNIQGKIINISSATGIDAEKYHSHYAASKAAVIGFSKAAALELGDYGIRVNVIAPGAIETEGIMEPDFFPDSQDVPEDFQDIQIRKNSFLGIMGTPEDIADMALYLASDKAKYITGAVISIDGGRVLL